jgi:hypothetical protein
MDKRLEKVSLVEELEVTFEAVMIQLLDDEDRWGDTWKERGLVWKGQPQEERWFSKMQEYIDDFRENGTPINWKKVIGEAHIALVRERKLK